MAFSSKYDFNFKKDKSNSFIIFVFGFLVYCMTLAFMSGIFTYSLTDNWKSSLTGKLTIEFPVNVDGVKESITEKQKEEVINIVQAVPGIISIRKIKEADILKILEPYLSGTAVPDDFPFPTLFDVNMEKDSSVNLLDLTAKLSKISQNVRIHEHSRWYEPIAQLSLGLFGFSMLLAILILMTVCATIIFITRKTLREHHEVVKILQLIGAKDKYISSQFRRYYFSLSIKGTLLSILLSISTIFGITYLINGDLLSLTNIKYMIASVITPIIVICITMLTSQITVVRLLKSEDWID